MPPGCDDPHPVRKLEDGSLANSKRQPAAARGPSPLRVPPKGSFLDHCVQALLISATEMRENSTSLSLAERRAAAWFIKLAEPRRPWLWPIWAYVEMMVRPQFAETMGEAAANSLCDEHPNIAFRQAVMEMYARKMRAPKEAKQDPLPDYRDLTNIIVGAAYEEYCRKTGGVGSANSRHAAIADRLGLDDVGVIRRWERRHFAKCTNDELEAYVHVSPRLDWLAATGRVRSRVRNGGGFAEARA